MHRAAALLVLLLSARSASAGTRNWLQTWGGGDKGQLGQGTLLDSWKPRTVRQLLGTAPVEVAFGYSHGLALSFSQEVFSWGQGTFGALGRAFVDNSSGMPREVLLPTPQIVSDLQGYAVLEVAAGGWHSAARLENGNVMTWGYNAYGQLGRRRRVENAPA